MVIVAGPPARSNTTRFPVAEFGVYPFNTDNRAAQLNDELPRYLERNRFQVNVEFHKWIL